MARVTKIKLSTNYEAFGRTYSEIEVKEPTGSLLLVHGEPEEAIFLKDGSVMIHTNRESLKAYIEACCTPGIELICQLGVEDMRAVRAAVLAFFATPAGGSPAQ